MMKTLAVLVLTFIALPVFAFDCPQALPSSDTKFCASFQTSAQCYCTSSGYPQSICSDMDALYNLMMVRYWSIKKACKHQDQVPVQDCIDAWTCYRDGGKNSAGQLCSGTGKSCL